MSTRGSALTDATLVSEAPQTTRTRIFRWQGIIPLLLILGLMAAGWAILGNIFLRDTAVEASTKALGTQVDVSSLDLSLRRPRITMRGLQIADPFNARRNLFDAGTIIADLDGRALLERKFVIRRLDVRDAHAGSARTVVANPVKGGGFAPSALREMRDWAAQFRVPLLSLTPIDTIRSIVLDPTQLATVKAALELRQRADSVRDAVEESWKALQLQETLDSSRALVTRLGGSNPRTLGLDGTRRAVADVRRGIRQVDSAKKRVERLEKLIIAGTTRLTEGVRDLDSARLGDYAFARGLLKLPTFDAPEIGAALFGKVSIDQFQKALYWTEIAGHYVPPGLRPRTTAGPARARRSGTTVHFPKARSYPRFLLQQGDIAIGIGRGPSASRYAARITGATSEPALVGEPMRIRIRRLSGPASGFRLSADGSLDHRAARPKEDAVVSAAGIALPRFALPGVPLQLDPRAAEMKLQFVRDGDRIAARWDVASDSVVWLPDSARAVAGRREVRGTMELLVMRVLTGIQHLDLTAELKGDIKKPRLSVRSNLDRAIAERLRAVVGEEVKRAELRVRAAVDQIIERETAPIKARVATAREVAMARVDEAKKRIDAEKAALEERLRGLAGGLIGG